MYIEPVGPLIGTVRASGAKNAALPMMAASILTEESVHLLGVPRVVDVGTLASALAELGVAAQWQPDGVLELRTTDNHRFLARRRWVGRMRASFCVLGPLLARRGKAIVGLPGGCAIGSRPVDIHLRGLAALGADLKIERGYVVARATRRLRGADVSLLGPHGPSVTATAQVLMAATLAQGTTVIRHAAREPEIADLCLLLGRMGARIAATDPSTLVVDGVERLHRASHRVMPDRIETGTWLLAGAMTRGRVTVENAVPEHSTRLAEVLSDVGATIRSGTDWLSVSLTERPRAFRIAAEPYPGFPTDLQPQLAALAAVANGTSSVYDRVFPERFAYAVPLRRFGVAIEHHGEGIRVRGTSRLRGARARACDLRCGAALLLAALAARGPSMLKGVAHLRRGYESLESKLRQLGLEVSPSVVQQSASQAQ